MIAASQLGAREKVGAVVAAKSEWSHCFNTVLGPAVPVFNGTDGATVSRVDIERGFCHAWDILHVNDRSVHEVDNLCVLVRVIKLEGSDLAIKRQFATDFRTILSSIEGHYVRRHSISIVLTVNGYCDAPPHSTSEHSDPLHWRLSKRYRQCRSCHKGLISNHRISQVGKVES
jgi:hypothetical protein